MQKKTLQEFVLKDSPAAWIGSMHVMLDELSVDVRNSKQQIEMIKDNITRLNRFMKSIGEDRVKEKGDLIADASKKVEDRKWLCGKCDQQKMREAGILAKDVEEFPDHFRTCDKRNLPSAEGTENAGYFSVKGDDAEWFINQKKEEKERWRPDGFTPFYYISDTLEVRKRSGDTPFAKLLSEFNGCFPTETQAKHAASEIRKLLKSLQQ